MRMSSCPRLTAWPASTKRSSTFPETRKPRSLWTRAATVPVKERDAETAVLNGGGTHQRRLGARIGRRLVVAGDQRERQGAKECGCNEAARIHEGPIDESIRTPIVITVTVLVNGHYRFGLRRQAAQHQPRQLRRRLVRVSEAVLQHQRVDVGVHDQVDRCRRLIDRRLALEVAGLPPLLAAPRPATGGCALHGRWPTASARSLPRSRSRRACGPGRTAGGSSRQMALNMRRSFSGGRVGPVDRRANIRSDLAQAVRTDHFADRLLGLEELVDVRLGEADGLGKVGNRGLLVSVPAEMLGRRNARSARARRGRPAPGSSWSGCSRSP